MVWLHTSTEFLWDICIVRISIRSACPICAKGTKQCKCLLGVAVVSFGYNPTPRHVYIYLPKLRYANWITLCLWSWLILVTGIENVSSEWLSSALGTIQHLNHPRIHIFVQIKIYHMYKRNNTVYMTLVDSCDRNRKCLHWVRFE